MTAERIYIAGHRGMVGSAIVRTLLAQGVPQSALVTRTHAELDLCNQQAVQEFFASEQPTQIYRQLPRWAASMPTTPIRLNSSIKT